MRRVCAVCCLLCAAAAACDSCVWLRRLSCAFVAAVCVCCVIRTSRLDGQAGEEVGCLSQQKTRGWGERAVQSCSRCRVVCAGVSLSRTLRVCVCVCYLAWIARWGNTRLVCLRSVGGRLRIAAATAAATAREARGESRQVSVCCECEICSSKKGNGEWLICKLEH